MRTAGLVLAGGRSSRMGCDKALLDFCGVPLHRHQHRLLDQAGCDPVLVSGSRFDLPDDPDAGQGPLAGIQTALRWLAANLSASDSVAGLLVLPVDLPLMTVDLINQLMAQQRACYFAASVMPCWIPADAGASLMRSRQHSNRVIDFLNVIGAVALPLDDTGPLANFNTPEDWLALLTRS